MTPSHQADINAPRERPIRFLLSVTTQYGQTLAAGIFTLKPGVEPGYECTIKAPGGLLVQEPGVTLKVLGADDAPTLIHDFTPPELEQ